MNRLSEDCQLIIKHILKRTDEYNMHQKNYNQISVTINRIQKILYLSQVEDIKHTGKTMFEEDFYALPLGPEVIEVRNFYMDYCTGRIDTLKFPNGTITQDKKQIVDIILECTNEMDNVTLSKNVCKMDNIWINTYRSQEDNNKLISKTQLISYYKPNNKPKTKKRTRRNTRYYKQNTIK